jgi:hypothetical protein
MKRIQKRCGCWLDKTPTSLGQLEDGLTFSECQGCGAVWIFPMDGACPELTLGRMVDECAFAGLRVKLSYKPFPSLVIK